MEEIVSAYGERETWKGSEKRRGLGDFLGDMWCPC